MAKKIMWDPGHGGSDPGATANGLQEEHLTFKIVQYAVTYLNANYTGFEQRITRGHEQTLALSNRDDAADAWGANVFVSVHINAGKGTGFESYIYNSAGASTISLQNMIRNEVLAAMRQFGSITDRGKRRADFAVLRETNMDAILTENLFIDSADSNRLKDENFIKAVGEAHARGVAKFLGLPSKPTPQPTLAPKSDPAPNIPSVVYEAHIQEIGWQGERRNGQTAGTVGENRRMEALTVRLENTDAKLEMEAHIQDKGWTSVRTSGEVLGTVGSRLQMEAVKFRTDIHPISYRVHVQNIGWTEWKENGEEAGTTGQGLRIEAIEIKLG